MRPFPLLEPPPQEPAPPIPFLSHGLTWLQMTPPIPFLLHGLAWLQMAQQSSSCMRSVSSRQQKRKCHCGSNGATEKEAEEVGQTCSIFKVLSVLNFGVFTAGIPLVCHRKI